MARVAKFTVTLSKPFSQAVTVDYQTVAESAHAGEDFTSTTGTLTFAPGETSKVIAVPVRSGDQGSEERFKLQLLNAAGGVLHTAEAECILPALTMSVADAALEIYTPVTPPDLVVQLDFMFGGTSAEIVLQAFSGGDLTRLVPAGVTKFQAFFGVISPNPADPEYTSFYGTGSESHSSDLSHIPLDLGTTNWGNIGTPMTAPTFWPASVADAGLGLLDDTGAQPLAPPIVLPLGGQPPSNGMTWTITFSFNTDGSVAGSTAVRVISGPQPMFLDNFVGPVMRLALHTPDVGTAWAEQPDGAQFQLDSVGLMRLDTVGGQSTVSTPIEAATTYTVDIDFVNNDLSSDGEFTLTLEDGTEQGQLGMSLNYFYNQTEQTLGFQAIDHYETTYGQNTAAIELAIDYVHRLRLRLTPELWEIYVDGVQWYSVPAPSVAFTAPTLSLYCRDNSITDEPSFRFDRVALYAADLGPGADYMPVAPMPLPPPPASPPATALAALNPTQISDNGVVQDNTFGQFISEYQNSPAEPVVQYSSVSGPVMLDDGSALHYQVSYYGSEHPDYASDVFCKLVPARLTTLPASDTGWMLDPVVDAAWIANFNLRVPFNVEFYDAQDRLVARTLFYNQLKADNNGNWPTPDAVLPPSTMLWIWENAGSVTQVRLSARLASPGVREVPIRPLPVWTRSWNPNVAGDPQVAAQSSDMFGELQEDEQTTNLYTEYSGGSNYDPAAGAKSFGQTIEWFKDSHTACFMYRFNATTQQVEIWLTPGTGGNGYSMIAYYGQYLNGPNGQFEAWYDAQLPLRVEVLDIDSNVLAVGTFTDNAATVGSSVPPKLTVPTVGWTAAEPRTGWKLRFTPNAA